MILGNDQVWGVLRGRKAAALRPCVPQNFGFLPRDPGTLDLGPVSSISMVLPGSWQVSGSLDLGSQLLPPPQSPPVLAPQCLVLKRGVRGCQLSDAIRTVAHFTPCHLSDRTHSASDSPTSSFPTWHLESTLDDMGRQGASPIACWLHLGAPWAGGGGGGCRAFDPSSPELPASQEKLLPFTRP